MITKKPRSAKRGAPHNKRQSKTTNPIITHKRFLGKEAQNDS